MVSPGNSIGTQAITGNFVQGTGGTLAIELDGSGMSDRLDISGSATLAGTLNIILTDADFEYDTPHTFLTAGSVSGAFATINRPDLGSLVSTDVSVGTASTITFTKNSVVTVSSNGSGQTTASKMVASALDEGFKIDPGGTAGLFSSLNSQGTDQLNATLASAAGTVQASATEGGLQAMGMATSVAQANFGDNGTSSANSGMAFGNGGRVNFLDRGAVWSQGFGGFGDLDSDSGSRCMDYTVWGGAAGVESDVSEDLILGLFGSYAQSESNISGLADEAEADVYQLGVYTGARQGAWSADWILSGAWLNIETARPLSTGTAQADYNGYAGSADMEVAYAIPLDYGVTMYPTAGLEGSVVHTEDYAETGAGTLNQSFDEQTTKKLTSLVGGKLRGQWDLGGLSFLPTVSAAWAHQYLDDSAQVNSAFAVSTATAFTAEGPSRDRDSARISASLDLSGQKGAGGYGYTFFTAYDSDITGNASDHAFRAGGRINW
jgi:uncharacterized protein with beta-barrel porin domain